MMWAFWSHFSIGNVPDFPELCLAEIAQDRASCSKMTHDHGLDPSRFDLQGLDLVLGLPNPSLVHALGELPDPSKIWGCLMTKTLLVCGRGLAQGQLQSSYGTLLCHAGAMWEKSPVSSKISKPIGFRPKSLLFSCLSLPSVSQWESDSSMLGLSLC